MPNLPDNNVIACVQENLNSLNHIQDILEHLHRLEMDTDPSEIDEIDRRIDELRRRHMRLMYEAEIRSTQKKLDALG